MDPKTVEKLEGKIGEASAEIIVKMGLKKSRKGRNWGGKKRNPGRVDLGGCPPRSPTDPGLHITRTRFLIS